MVEVGLARTKYASGAEAQPATEGMGPIAEAGENAHKLCAPNAWKAC
jgi:hypothetical protein